VDGEPIGHTPVTISLEAAAIDVLTPRPGASG
jgi:diacylglycerol kinase family enzyme